MNYPVTTAQQLRAVLVAMRKARALSQAGAGQRLGVNQKRLARIEGTPGVTSFDQISRLVSALGGRLVVEVPEHADAPVAQADKGKAPARPRKSANNQW